MHLLRLVSSFANILDLGRQILGVRAAEQDLHAANIANAKTPDYTAKASSFSIQFDKARQLMAGAQGTSQNVSPWKVEMEVQESKEPAEENGNNVRLDRELAMLSQNSLQYLTTVKLISKEIAIQKYAITEGR